MKSTAIESKIQAVEAEAAALQAKLAGSAEGLGDALAQLALGDKSAQAEADRLAAEREAGTARLNQLGILRQGLLVKLRRAQAEEREEAQLAGRGRAVDLDRAVVDAAECVEFAADELRRTVEGWRAVVAAQLANRRDLGTKRSADPEVRLAGYIGHVLHDLGVNPAPWYVARRTPSLAQLEAAEQGQGQQDERTARQQASEQLRRERDERDIKAHQKRVDQLQAALAYREAEDRRTGTRRRYDDLQAQLRDAQAGLERAQQLEAA